MKKIKTGIIIVALVISGAIIGKYASQASTFNERENINVSGSDKWSDASKKAIEHMKKMYGEPAEQTESMMIWNKTGPWKKTIVYAREVRHDFPMPHMDVIEQFIDYKVPVDKFDDLAQYDGSIVCNRTKGEISARCDKEGANILAINLANDVIMGDKDVKSARDFYAKTITEFMKGGKPSYMAKFQFMPAMGNTADPDEMSPLIDKQEMMKMKKEKGGASNPE